MTKRPSIKDRDIGVFFGKPSTKIERQNSTKTEQRNSRITKPEKLSRKLIYQNKWRQEGKTQVSLWLPATLVKKLKIQAILKDRNSSQLVTDLLSKTLQEKEKNERRISA